MNKEEIQHLMTTADVGAVAASAAIRKIAKESDNIDYKLFTKTGSDLFLAQLLAAEFLEYVDAVDTPRLEAAFQLTLSVLKDHSATVVAACFGFRSWEQESELLGEKARTAFADAANSYSNDVLIEWPQEMLN